MQKLVSYWDVGWTRESAVGTISLTFDDRSVTHLASLAHDELNVLCNILRSEKNVYYDAEAGELTTVAQPVEDTR